MTASNDLTYRERRGEGYGYEVLAGQTLYGRAAGGVTAAGKAVPAGHVSCVALLGLAEERRVGGEIVRFRKGTYNLPIAGATYADIGKSVYASADDTFTLTAGSLLKIGTLVAVDADGCWVSI